ncbi:ATP-grasp ribosomal peptide maturase [Amycolatopsis umgeniensis]|uniref:ATP-grasp ribosomal peptide maturase n=1 Tax=Amycolatopsis umgeniensis TaxID=336628 RepID=A0A841BGZ9_9PSEU|nr:ATP-grasp ribosomal peptide maturase [Amycolatopsis umgeniensis]MBB5858300.1 ATP-grasp ribosomal peptide maturase [Amycolatopsis umgeniensis]
MTVLILASERDFTADRMVAALERRGTPVARVDTAWFPRYCTIDARLRNGRWMGTLSAHSRTIALEGLRSVWYRSPSAFTFPAELSATERNWAMSETKLGLGGVLTSLAVRWINHPSRNADAAYKPVQLTTAVQCGLSVADTLVTSVRTSVHEFVDGGETITKAFGAAAVIEDGGRKTTLTDRVTADTVADLRGLEVAAHQFQRWIPKAHEARVIVVGEHVFAAGIYARTPKTYLDYRNDYLNLRYRRLEPPETIAGGILRYCRAFGLAYGAFDFVIRPDGEWVFLECNAGGQYGWIEDAIAAPITDTIADLLTQGETS